MSHLLALLARMGFPHMRDREARSVFLGYLAAALEGVALEPAPVGLLHLGLRRRLLEVVGGLRGRGCGRGPGRGLVATVVRVGVSVYYLGDALEVFSRLTPPRRAPWPLPTSTTSPGASPPSGIRCASRS